MYCSRIPLKKIDKTYLHGERKLYYSDGDIKEITNWNKGVLHGEQQYFAKKGVIQLYKKYWKGELVYMVDYELEDDRPDSVS